VQKGKERRSTADPGSPEPTGLQPGIPVILIFIYKKCKHDIVSTKSVYSVRIDPLVRKMMEEMGELDWQEKIRHLIEDSVRKERRQFLLARAKQAHRDQPAGPPAAAMIREDRDAR